MIKESSTLNSKNEIPEEENFALSSSSDYDKLAGAIYYFSGWKSLGMTYEHNKDSIFNDLVCFKPVDTNIFTYLYDAKIVLSQKEKNDMSFCADITKDLLSKLNKDNLKQVKNAFGDIVLESFEGSVNLLVNGYTIDTRGMETYNKLDIVKINKVYK